MLEINNVYITFAFYMEIDNDQKGKKMYVTIVATFSLNVRIVNQLTNWFWTHSKQHFLQGFGKVNGWRHFR